MALSACTLSSILTGDTLNEGRIKLNDNFNCLSGVTYSGTTLFDSLSANTFYLSGENIYTLIEIARTGDTTVSGGTNIGIATDGTTPENYTVNLNDDITLGSISGTSISASTIFSGSTNLSDLFQENDNIIKPFKALTDDSTISWDYSLGYNAKIILTGATGTLAISGVTDGDSGILYVIQDGTGSRSMNLPAGSEVANAGGGSIAFTSNIDAKDIISFKYDGNIYVWNVSYDYS